MLGYKQISKNNFFTKSQYHKGNGYKLTIIMKKIMFFVLFVSTIGLTSNAAKGHAFGKKPNMAKSSTAALVSLVKYTPESPGNASSYFNTGNGVSVSTFQKWYMNHIFGENGISQEGAVEAIQSMGSVSAPSNFEQDYEVAYFTNNGQMVWYSRPAKEGETFFFYEGEIYGSRRCLNPVRRKTTYQPPSTSLVDTDDNEGYDEIDVPNSQGGSESGDAEADADADAGGGSARNNNKITIINKFPEGYGQTSPQQAPVIIQEKKKSGPGFGAGVAVGVLLDEGYRWLTGNGRNYRNRPRRGYTGYGNGNGSNGSGSGTGGGPVYGDNNPYDLGSTSTGGINGNGNGSNGGTYGNAGNGVDLGNRIRYTGNSTSNNRSSQTNSYVPQTNRTSAVEIIRNTAVYAPNPSATIQRRSRY